MKKLSLVILIALIGAPILGLADGPKVGTYRSEDGDFDAGMWAELLWGGQEGAPGNEITAGSDAYAFEGAYLDNVALVDSPPAKPFFEYKTVYLGGTIALSNSTAGAWANAGDAAGAFVGTLDRTTVFTKKYVDDVGDRTGEMSFRLSTEAIFAAYPDISATVEAEYDRAIPDVDTGVVPPVVSDDLSSATVIIRAPLDVDIKPGSCKNPVNIGSRGVVFVAVYGSSILDATEIDPMAVTLAGVPPVRYAWFDAGSPCACMAGGGLADEDEDDDDCEVVKDGITDFGMLFYTHQLAAALGEVSDGDVVEMVLDAELLDGTELSGVDYITVIKKKGPKGPKRSRR